jgi:hypothetical protein
MTSFNLIGGLQDAFMEALMCFGVGFCSIEDAHSGAPQRTGGACLMCLSHLVGFT